MTPGKVTKLVIDGWEVVLCVEMKLENQIELKRDRKRIPGGTAETKGRLRGQK